MVEKRPVKKTIKRYSYRRKGKNVVVPQHSRTYYKGRKVPNRISRGQVTKEELRNVGFITDTGDLKGDAPVESIKGIGIKIAKVLRANGINTVDDYRNYILLRKTKKSLQPSTVPVIWESDVMDVRKHGKPYLSIINGIKETGRFKGSFDREFINITDRGQKNTAKASFNGELKSGMILEGRYGASWKNDYRSFYIVDPTQENGLRVLGDSLEIKTKRRVKELLKLPLRERLNKI